MYILCISFVCGVLGVFGYYPSMWTEALVSRSLFSYVLLSLFLFVCLFLFSSGAWYSLCYLGLGCLATRMAAQASVRPPVWRFFDGVEGVPAFAAGCPACSAYQAGPCLAGMEMGCTFFYAHWVPSTVTGSRISVRCRNGLFAVGVVREP